MSHVLSLTSHVSCLLSLTSHVSCLKSHISCLVCSRNKCASMEKIEKFQIVFNNPAATYFAGETVYGYGWLVVKEPVYVS
ncbi:arrestin domain-containing protein 3, partial [Biomphalaria glabrata]